MKSYKTNIKPKYFYAYLVLIFLFVMIFSISFLINQIINKEKIIIDFIKNKDQLTPNSEEYNEAFNKAKETWYLWSLPTYFGGISTIIIFLVFVLFGRTKVSYGYFFRTLWTIIFLGSATFMFFIEGLPLWQKIINFIIILALAIITIFDLINVNKSREDLKFEIRNEWYNKRANKNFINRTIDIERMENE